MTSNNLENCSKFIEHEEQYEIVFDHSSTQLTHHYNVISESTSYELQPISGKWASNGPSYVFSTQSTFLIDTQALQEHLNRIYSHIKKQEAILMKYEENWDDNGAHSLNSSIFQDIYFILNEFYLYLIQSQKLSDLNLPIPNLFPNTDGSIDLSWRDNNIHILLNLKFEDKLKRISIAGKINSKKVSYQDNSIELDQNIGSIIASWI